MPSDLERALSALLRPKRQPGQQGANIVSAGVPDNISRMASESETETTYDWYFEQVKLDAPVGYWRLNEIAGATAYDWSLPTSPYNGAYNGTVTLMQAGPLGDLDYAALFNGTTGYVSVGDVAAFHLTTGSVEAWFKCSSTGFRYIAGQEDNDANRNGFMLALNGGTVLFQVGSGAAFQNLNSAASAYNDGAWHHAVGTFDGSNLRLYVDGAQVNSAAQTVTPAYAGNSFRIGRNVNADYFFAGTLKDLAVYATALSAARVAAHYNARAGYDPNDLLCCGMGDTL